MRYKINMFPSKEKPDPVRTVYDDVEYLNPAVYRHRCRYGALKLVRAHKSMHPNEFVPQSFQNTRAKTYHATCGRRNIPVSDIDSYHIVNQNTENRLDRIAYMYYNDFSLWWVIADANPEIRFDPFNVPRGMSLRIPHISTLYSGGILNVR